MTPAYAIAMMERCDERVQDATQDLVKALKRALEDLEDTAVLVQQGLASRENILRSIEIKVTAARNSLRKAGA